MFLLTAAGFVVVSDRRSRRSMIGNGLHVVMALGMAVMAWPAGLRVPEVPAEIFFLAAAAWFAGTAAAAAHPGVAWLKCGYHVAMMLAMAWMYAVMGGQLVPAGSGPQGAHGSHGAHGSAPETSMPGTHPPGMDVAGKHMPGAHDSAHGAAQGWVGAGNWFWTILFAAAVAVWGNRFVSRRRETGRWRSGAVEALQAMMAAGMAIMFGIMVFQP